MKQRRKAPLSKKQGQTHCTAEHLFEDKSLEKLSVVKERRKEKRERMKEKERRRK